MRIVSVHPGAVAFVFALAYAFAGLVSFVAYAFSSLQTLLLPIGIVLGMFHLVFNIHVARSTDLLGNAFLCLSSVLCYAATGWISGAVVAVCFNLIAQKTGGIDAKFVSVKHDGSETARASLDS